ncbi:MAG: metallophosphoesterase [Syntrophaceae bacterium]|nr:metallophosphoesterase [Syntrophaceae bacterium]
MKIGVISDTHLTDYDVKFADNIKKLFKETDLIVHAGDVVSAQVLDMFANKELKVVCGNMDPISLHKHYPEKMVFEIDGFRFALVHDINKIKGWGMSKNLAEKIGKFFGKVDCLIHGHTHDPSVEKEDGIILFNPGSATNNRNLPFNTVGIIDINDHIEVEILEIA